MDLRFVTEHGLEGIWRLRESPTMQEDGGDLVSGVGAVRIRWGFMRSLTHTYNHSETMVLSGWRRIYRKRTPSK